jgi:hypothetical protein
MKTPALLTALALVLTAMACQPTQNSLLRRGDTDAPDDGDGTPSSPSHKPKTGQQTGQTPSPAPSTNPTTTPTTDPAGKPLDPNGFTAKIAPMLDAQGCTECHHAGRPIDLTKYPFMTGAANDTADRLTRSLTTTMPPAPREKAPSSIADAIAAWKAAGMKP